MSDAYLPLIAGMMFGSVLIFAGILWKINRPWEIFYKIMFFFFGMWIMIGTLGFADIEYHDPNHNQGSSPSLVIDSHGSDTFLHLAYWNSTGDLMVVNSTDDGLTWSAPIIAAPQDGTPQAALDISDTNLVNAVRIGYITVVFFILFFIIEIFMWFKNLAEEGGRMSKIGRHIGSERKR